jgi:hypothetical protein
MAEVTAAEQASADPTENNREADHDDHDYPLPVV